VNKTEQEAEKKNWAILFGGFFGPVIFQAFPEDVYIKPSLSLLDFFY
jgi:hypothetical protein